MQRNVRRALVENPRHPSVRTLQVDLLPITIAEESYWARNQSELTPRVRARAVQRIAAPAGRLSSCRPRIRFGTATRCRTPNREMHLLDAAARAARPRHSQRPRDRCGDKQGGRRRQGIDQGARPVARRGRAAPCELRVESGGEHVADEPGSPRDVRSVPDPRRRQQADVRHARTGPGSRSAAHPAVDRSGEPASRRAPRSRAATDRSESATGPDQRSHGGAEQGGHRLAEGAGRGQLRAGRVERADLAVDGMVQAP